MKCFLGTHDKTTGSFPEQELTEEQFFEQFAALEDGPFKFRCAACPKTLNSSAASQRTCGDQFALRLYQRDKSGDQY
jgi:hypothetical protein